MKPRVLLLLLSLSYAGSQAIFTFPPVASPAPVRAVAGIGPSRVMSKTITLNHRLDIDWVSMAAQISPLSRAVRPAGSRFLFLEGEKSALDRIETWVQQIDIAPQTIEYSVAVVEVSRQGIEQLGVDWQGFFNNWKSTREHGMVQALDQLNALMKSGEAKLRASPKLVSVEGIDAKIRIGDRVPYTVPYESATKTGWQLQYLDTGIDLKLKGYVLEGNVIRTQIQATISNIKQWKATPAGDYPILSSREVVLEGEVKTGETLILGGLSTHQERSNRQSVPFLGDIPGFRSVLDMNTTEQEASEVVFMLTPVVKN
jgi:type II secretory pathway component GspD/PulD (secretin)